MTVTLQEKEGAGNAESFVLDQSTASLWPAYSKIPTLHFPQFFWSGYTEDAPYQVDLSSHSTVPLLILEIIQNRKLLARVIMDDFMNIPALVESLLIGDFTHPPTIYTSFCAWTAEVEL